MNQSKENSKNLAMGNDSSMGRSSLRLGRMRDVSELSLGDFSSRNDRSRRHSKRCSLPTRSSSVKGGSQRKSLPSRTASGSGILKKQTLQDSLASIDDILNGSANPSSSNNSSRSSSVRRMPVQFDTAEIREYPVILDSSREGPALTIDWNHSAEKFTTVDLHKETKKQTPARCLDPAERTIILLESGAVSKGKLLRHLSSDSFESMNRSVKGGIKRAGKKNAPAWDVGGCGNRKSKASTSTTTKNNSKNEKPNATRATNKTMLSKMKVTLSKMAV